LENTIMVSLLTTTLLWAANFVKAYIVDI
jgi:hypothetical protein